MTLSQEYFQNADRLAELRDEIYAISQRHLVVTDEYRAEMTTLQTEFDRVKARSLEIIAITESAEKIYDVANMTCWEALQLENGTIERIREVPAPRGVILSQSGQYPRSAAV